MITPANKIEVKSSLDLICDAIHDAARRGERMLTLYNYNVFDGKYYRCINYTELDLQKLRDAKYIVRVKHTETHYTGMLWWRKEYAKTEYHAIYW